MPKTIRCLGLNLTKEVKDLYSENYKILMKEIEYYTNGKILHALGLEKQNTDKKTKTMLRERWQRRRMLGSPCPADHLDSTHICLNNPKNCQKTRRTDSLEPSIDKRPMEEGRKG